MSENLEFLPAGERLATNALFQAYDDILPLYGLDPEKDQHISRLVFRIGGERGDGLLMEKLRAVLSRMGIGLEFDSRSDGSRIISDHGNGSEFHNGPRHEGSVQQSLSLSGTDGHSESSEDEPLPPQPAHQEKIAPTRHSASHETYHLGDSGSPPGLTHTDLGLNSSGSEPANSIKKSQSPTPPRPPPPPPPLPPPLAPPPPPQSYTTSTVGNTELTGQNNHLIAGNNKQQGSGDTTAKPLNPPIAGPAESEIKTTALDVSKPRRRVNWVLPPDNTTEPSENGDGLAHLEDEPVVRESDAQEPTRHGLAVQQPVGHGVGIQGPVTHSPAEHPFEQGQPVEEPLSSQIEHEEGQGTDLQTREDLEAEAWYALLKRQSRKAAGYLLLLRGISHWRQHALDKLERTAVARRHIMRMRHFDSWELVTAETRFKGRRIFTTQLLALWLRRADEAIINQHCASAHAQRKSIQNALSQWSASCPTYIQPQHASRSMNIYLQHWHSACVSSSRLQPHIETLCQRQEMSQATRKWHRQALSHIKSVASFRRFSVVCGSLGQWHLHTRVEFFRAKLRVKLIHSSLSRWQAACQAPPSLGEANSYGRGRHVDPQGGRTRRPRQPRGGRFLMDLSNRMLKTKVLGNWQRQASVLAKTSTRSRRFAVHQGAQKALESWHFDADYNRSLNMWSKRGYFYVSATHVLKTWRSRTSWRSSTRKLYAQCRQHVKATFTKGHLGRWKTVTRSHRNISWEAIQHHGVVERARLVRMLETWLDKSRNDWGAGRLLTAAWLNEWRRVSQYHAETQGHAKQAWGLTLKSRYWSQWQSTLLQLKSREYVALDVRERNRKKVVRRLLLYWKGDRGFSTSQQSTATRPNLASSRRGVGFGLGHSSVPLSRAVHERAGGLSLRGSNIQEVGPAVEDEDHDGTGSGPDVDGVVMDTPTRWTGMASSVRLPSMTPFAPLTTPFERQLRERYNQSMPPAPTGQLSRLSFAQAQRLSVADTRRAPDDSMPEGSSSRK
ncbi:hypothetical protein CTA2_3404 [Colletotrichum tanaceti]|uniref:Sfi1 spindle body domain-containing protein n=1 Tax=Colletotrichum tanaceti TaxID=1306861 RepID=A0A4V6DIB1_9PEZI|nr:hypothetical protein CTA2_3404 [Colletotrichum tanaceti]TKW59826.1 hypothetical protein CTA1_1445 [Colletotrichum tanaceti]